MVKSLHLRPEDLEAHNRDLQAKFARIAANETRCAGEALDDAEIVLVGYGSAARIARTAIERGRAGGLAIGLFRPITLWPFPSDALRAVAERTRALVVVELSAGQLVEDVRLTVEGRAPVFFHGRTGGMTPTPGEVLRAAQRAFALTAPAPKIGVTHVSGSDPNAGHPGAASSSRSDPPRARLRPRRGATTSRRPGDRHAHEVAS